MCQICYYWEKIYDKEGRNSLKLILIIDLQIESELFTGIALNLH